MFLLAEEKTYQNLKLYLDFHVQLKSKYPGINIYVNKEKKKTNFNSCFKLLLH